MATTATGGRVTGKVAIVTGGASGIGAGVARRLAAEGARVAITDLSAERGQAMADEIGGLFIRHDVTVEQGWREVMDRVGADLGPLDILVNNAGIGNQGGETNPENTSLDKWREMVRINGEGVFLGCRFGIEAMKARGGAIVNMSSIASMVPSPPIAAYGFAKAGVEQFSRSVALHCAQAGYRIRCNSIHPGQIHTPLLDGLFRDGAAQHGMSEADMRAAFLSRVPLGEFGTPDDIAYGILYLVSEEGRYVTGTHILIDGGMGLIS